MTEWDKMQAHQIYNDFDADLFNRRVLLEENIGRTNSKWIKDLNVTPETIKLLEENIGRTIDDINQSKILYDPPPRVIEIKTRVNKWDLIKLKSFGTAKESISNPQIGDYNSK